MSSTLLPNAQPRPLERFLRLFTDVRDGEGAQVVLLALNVFLILTAYYVMKIGRLPLIPYYRRGDPKLGDAIRGCACRHCAVLLANHGPVVSGATLDAAVNAIEELEETAKLFLLLRNTPTRPLSKEQIDELNAIFGLAGQSG